MKSFITAILTATLLFHAFAETQAADQGKTPPISKVMADPPVAASRFIITGKLLGYDDMVYPRFRFDIREDSGEVKTVFLNVVEFPDFESKLSQGIIGRRVNVEIRKAGYPCLVKVVFPAKKKTFDAGIKAQPGMNQVLARFKKEVVHNHDIYEEWILFELENGEELRFEGNLGIDSSFAGDLAEIVYGFEQREAVVGVEIAGDKYLYGRQEAIGTAIDLPAAEIDLPDRIGMQAYQDALAHMDVDEPLFEENKKTPANLFFATAMDLNRDGINEIMVRPSHEQIWCYASNCPLWIYKGNDNGYEKILLEYIADFQVLKETHNGFHKLAAVGHGSAVTSYYRIYSYQESEYRKEKCILETFDTDESGEPISSYTPCDE